MKIIKSIKQWIQNNVTANRVLTFTTDLTGLGSVIAGMSGVLPAAWQNAALAGIGLAVKLLNTLHFQHGSQKFDALTTAQDAIGSIADVAPHIVAKDPSSVPPDQGDSRSAAVSVPGAGA